MRGKKKRISNKRLLIILLILTIPIIAIVSINAFSGITDTTISTDFLSVSTGDFIDNTPNDGSGMLKVTTGGGDLHSFENKGVLSYSEDRKTVLFSADAVFGFEMTTHTEATWMDIFPQGYVKNWKLWYFRYATQSTTVYLWIFPVTRRTGDSYWHIKFDSIVFGPQVRHDYNGDIPITVTIDPGLKYTNDITIGENTFIVPKVIPDISKIKVVNYRAGIVGEYEDIYVDSTVEPDKAIELVVLSEKTSTETQKYTDFINSANIGDMTFGTMVKDDIQQQAISGDQVGTEYSTAGISNIVDFNYQMHLQPGVYKVHQDNAINAGQFGYDTATDYVVFAIDYPDFPWSRDVSVHVDNAYIHTDFIVKVNLVMTAEFDAALSESTLNDPNFELSNIIWDKTVGIESGRIAIPPPEPKWYDEYLILIITLIVVIVGLYIFIKLVIPYLRKRINRSSKRG
ncbi:hypothetical protein LCGC14_0770290 [marine sediment metagenome]|uniref:Uncharacterized protein n=1 Tax=marine sediment metagenome TaxID=412755 RepID=A0A0F9Q2S6_9ZZZZ